ncbi:MAG: DUF420 domain-containing protein [Candidatus Heimdallarchaeota archaeon]|nr:DUF420 domain-containing protein [Candidatus Heimdallarchaeota archaeon]
MQDQIPLLAITGVITITLGMILLIIAYLKAKQGDYRRHKQLMTGAITISFLFLIQYITRYQMGDETQFSGQEWVRLYIYLPVLTFHILTSSINIFLVIIHIWNVNRYKQPGPSFDKDYAHRHRRFGRIVFYNWFFNHITGIIVFIFLYVM